MKTNIKLAGLAVIAFLVFTVSSVQAQILITSFGNNAGNFGGWTYTSGTSTLSGTEGGGDVIGGNTSFTDYTGAIQIRIVADVTTAPIAGFSFVLQDFSSKTATANFSWTDFFGLPAGPNTIVANITSIDPGFNYAQIDTWLLVGGGGGNINAILTSATALTAVPEPSTYALLLFGAGALYLVRRRTAKV